MRLRQRQPSLPDHGPLPEEKRYAVVHARVGRDLQRFLEVEADQIGVTKSALINTLIAQRAGMARAGQRLRGLRHPVVTHLRRALAKAEAGVSDDDILDAGERADVTTELSEGLHAMYGERKRRA